FTTEDEVLGGYLIITPPSYENNSYLQQFVEWKRQKGLPCTVVNTNTTGGSATSIKTYIQNNVYNVWPIPPDFLVLVGDNDQGMPTHTYSGSGNATDLPYTLLEGTDYFPDMLAGRLSIDNDTQLSIVCSKSIMYEKTPYMAETNWFERGLMVYDYGGSLSCKNVKERCAHLMEEHNSAATIVHVTAPPNYSGGALINSNVNTGVIFVNYRGYGSYSSWTPPSYSISNMGGLNNGQKLPIITSIVCGGGNFVSSTDPCLGENWIRLGSGPLDVKGAVAFMGPTSLYTHTKWNNCIDGGIYQGVFKEDVRDVASALTRGKMELYYGMPNNQGSGGTTNSVECYFHIYNVLGDPGLQIWTKIPNILTVTHESALPLGVNYFEVNVQGPTGPVEDAVVCVYNQTHEYQEVLWTDESGNVLFDLEDAPAATYSVTVTGKNLKPHLGTLTISQESVALGISNFSVDDDMIGESSGDGDGHVNPGETIELVVTLENTGSSQTATSISGIASSADPHVNVTENTQTGPDAPPGTTSLLNDDFNLVISSEAPHSHVVPLTLFAVSSQGNWTNLINLEIIAPLAEATEYEVQNAAGYINPGELADVTVTLQNSGGDPLTDCSATLSSPDNMLTVTDNNGYWGQINAGQSAENTSNPFTLQAALTCPPGWTVPLEMIVTADGYADTLTVPFVVGQVQNEDPAGPDEYGYYCFDSRDSLYDQAPTYEWFEASTQPGQETLPLPDWGSEDDCSVVRDISFPFQYYGETYTEITICSNGWISMGNSQTYHSFRNWNIPGALGPPAMIAPFWDDLRFQFSGSVHYFYDFVNFRQVIEWKDPRTTSSGVNRFEIFLYDPSYWASSTGDGIIVFQYHTFNNNDGSENYSTIGIENWDQSDGVKVTYANIYTRGSATLQAGVALLFSTDIDYTAGVADIDVTLTPYGTPIQIPASGGTFEYNIAATNNEPTPQEYSIWCDVLLPGGTYFGPILGPFTINQLPGMTIDRDRFQDVPANAPQGSYQYNAYVGEYPGVIYNSDSFDLEKMQGPWVDPVPYWDSYGESFAGEVIEIATVIPAEFALLGAVPNPFNPTTTIRFALPEAAKVGLDVFDVSGRHVASPLHDGYREAGYHEVTFDGSELASGIYFYRLNAGAFTGAGKLLLLK
ncbi:MAG: C25 family cysteine peptidase, partial [Planctomycetota bacterium]